MIRYGIIRNGEHLSLHDTREDAEKAVEVEKEFDKMADVEGWGFSEGHYNIVTVKRLPW